METTDCDEGGEYDGVQDEPRHVLLAREAEMLFTGGHGLEKDPQKSGRAGQTCPCGGTGRDAAPVPLGMMARCRAECPLQHGPQFHQAPYSSAGLGGARSWWGMGMFVLMVILGVGGVFAI